MEEQVEAVQRMQDFIDAHLYEPITLAGLAQVSLYSPWYSYRLFVRQTGLTPADYIRRLRLSRSALRLRDGRVKVADLAFEVGFQSVDGYQKAFFREFGCNPRDYAANPVPIFLFRPYGVKYRLVKKEKTMEQAKTVLVQAVQKPARKVLIKRGIRAEDYWSYGEEVGCDVWGLLTSIPSIGGEPVCLWLPASKIKPGTSRYVQGAEVPPDYSGPVPEGFDVIEFPAGEFLMFQGEPFAEEDFCEAIGLVQAAIDRYDPSVIGYAWDDQNPRIQLEPIGTRGYIELLAVRKV